MNPTDYNWSELLRQSDLQFKPTQLNLCLPIIIRLSKKMILGVRFKAIAVHDNLICDGHHRYLASILTNIPIEIVQTMKTSGTILYQWEEVEFDGNDWDTNSKIEWLNKQDALFNNIPIDKFNALLK